jgi:hypothetical protein
LLTYAAETRPVVIYRFVMPEGAQVQGSGQSAIRAMRATNFI